MKAFSNQFAHDLKQVTDVVAAGVSGAALLQIIPAVAGLLSIVWLSIRIYELTTGKNFSDTKSARWLTKRG